MKGSISRLPNGRFYVSWYDKATRKTKKIYRYKGFRLSEKQMADKLLASMQGDVENGTFRLEKYTRGETDVIPYLHEWLTAVESQISPGTRQAYASAIKMHLQPFYTRNPLSLNEIAYDNLTKLRNEITREDAGVKFVLRVLHACLSFAWKSGRIQSVPPFPTVQVTERVIRWLSSEDQKKVIEAIPLEHQPIFWWMKYHLRRPGEAMALRKEDWDGQTFTVRRGISAKRLVERTKVGKVLVIPCVSEYLPRLEIESHKQKSAALVSPYLFCNPSGRTEGKRYTHVSLNELWKAACQKVGISIDMYSGLRHSTASQMVNEDGYSIADVQMAGQWSSRSVVERYAKTEMSRVKALLERKVVQLPKKEESNNG